MKANEAFRASGLQLKARIPALREIAAAQHPEEADGVHRPREQEALHGMAAELPQGPQILDVLHPHGADAKAEALRQFDGGRAHRLLGGVGGAARHVAAIELELDARQLAQPCQRGMGTPEIVDRYADVVEPQLGGDLPEDGGLTSKRLGREKRGRVRYEEPVNE